MKTVFFSFLFLLIGFACLAQQSLPQAYVTKELYVMLPTQEINREARVFEIDITELGLRTTEAAERFFNFFDDPYTSFHINIASQKVILTITPTVDNENWNIDQWAMYYKNKVAQQRQQLGYVDFLQR